MEYQPAVESYSGKIQEMSLGKVKIGGENVLPFHSFEGEMPNLPALALEVSTVKPPDWERDIFEGFQGVMDDSAAWAKKYVADLGVEVISLQLATNDAEGKEISAEDMVAAAAEIIKTVSVPVIVSGTGNVDMDREVLSKLAEVCADSELFLGPVKKDNYKEIAAACLKYGQGIVAQTPLDINAAKQLNTMLSREDFPSDKIMIDPLSSSLGYGMEYTYSIMERIKMAGLAHNDKMMQMPIIANIGTECQKTKEAKEDKDQGTLWEGITAVSLAMAGANMIVLRSPLAYKLVQKMLREV